MSVARIIMFREYILSGIQDFAARSKKCILIVPTSFGNRYLKTARNLRELKIQVEFSEHF